jgi:hypothetical protein
MQWLPTYLARNLGANKESISLTAVPYIINSMLGVGKGSLIIPNYAFVHLMTNLLLISCRTSRGRFNSSKMDCFVGSQINDSHWFDRTCNLFIIILCYEKLVIRSCIRFPIDGFVRV